MIWVAFAAMIAAALALLLPPLLRPRAAGPASRADYDLTVYKDQLAEIGRDLDRGLLTGEQAEAARTEVQRRILAAADGGKAGTAAPAAASRTVAVGVAVLVPALAFALYALLGSPWLPDRPFADRKAEIGQQARQMAQVQAMVQQLAARLQQNPQDGKGWAMLGRSWRVLGEPAKAADAYKKSIALLPRDVEPRLEFAGMLLEDAQQITPEVVTLLRQVLDIDPNQPDALYFVGQAEAEIGNKDKARALWTRLLNSLPADSSERPQIQSLIDGAK
ncbi:MAG: c-type cytochrome biogenesis protein CcmI [Actinomycetota bacterium]